MSSPRVTPFKVGRTVGAIYDYAEAGDTLAMHNHTEADSHTMIVVRGKILLRVEQLDGSVEETKHDAGAFVDTQPGFPHEIVALTKNARTIHHQK